jgi:hypothetical protein
MAVVTIRPGDTIKFETGTRRNHSPIGRINGNIVRYCNAIITGTWATGQPFPYERALSKLLSQVQELSLDDYPKVSPLALNSLIRVAAYIVDKPTRNTIYSLVHNIQEAR